MNQIKYLSHFLLFSLVIKTIIIGANPGEAIAITALSGLCGYMEWLFLKKQPDINQEIKNELDKIKSDVSKLLLSQQRNPQSNQPFRF